MFQTHIWDAGTGAVLQKLNANEPVIDICQIASQGQDWLATLTDKQLHVYRWTS